MVLFRSRLLVLESYDFRNTHLLTWKTGLSHTSEGRELAFVAV